MLSSIGGFLNRHRRKFLITGIVFGGSYVAFKFAKQYFLDSQERKAKELMESMRRVKHFESTERTCNQVIIALGAEMHEVILRELATSHILERLKEKPANKMKLWEELKVIVFTRLATFIYASSLLVIALRLQINLLGGYLYCDVREETHKISDEIKTKYLSFLQYFLKDGLLELIKMLKEKIGIVMQNLSLGQKMTLVTMEQVFCNIQMAVNSDKHKDPIAFMSKYLLSPQLAPEMASKMLQQMLDDTLDLLETDDVISVSSSLVANGFTLALDALAENFSVNSQIHINQQELPLAKIIPLLNTLTLKGLDCNSKPQNLPTSLLTFNVVSEKAKTLGVNVYESFSCSI